MDARPNADEIATMTAPVVGFDYAGLPVDVADRQRERADRIARLKRTTVEAMGEIGRELLEAQAELEHGTFLRWIEDAVGLSKSTAYRFMDVSKAFGAKLPTLGTLPVTVVQKLAERSVPEPVRASVLRRVEAGEVLKADVILEEVREAKNAERKRAATAREEARRAKLTDEQRAEEDALRGRGEKKREALARKEEREFEERANQEYEKDAEAKLGAMYLAVLLGTDLAGFVARFGSSPWRVFALAAALVDEQRAQDEPVVDLPVTSIDRTGRLSNFHRASAREREEMANIRARIETGAPVEPLVVKPVRQDRYGVVSEDLTFRVLADVLKRPTIQVRIVPPVEPIEDRVLANPSVFGSKLEEGMAELKRDMDETVAKYGIKLCDAS